MSIFNIYPPRENMVNRTYEIDLSLYEKLEYLSKEKYDASINKLLNTSIEFFLKNKKIDLYKRPKNEITIYRSFLLRESLYNGLNRLKYEYNISINKLVNMAIYNALFYESIDKKNP